MLGIQAEKWHLAPMVKSKANEQGAAGKVSLTSEQKAKWTSFFKTAKLDYK